MVDGATDPLKEFPARVKKVTLKNGLRLLILERPNTPTVSFSMFVRTGGLDDESGKTGLAHMFEHMLFKGTKTIGTTNAAKEEILLKKLDAAAAELQDEKDLGSQADPVKLQWLEEKFATLEKEHYGYLVEEEYWKIYERAGGQDLNASTGYDFTNYVISLPANQLKLWMAMERDRMINPVLREFYKERSVVLEERRDRLDNSAQGKLWQGLLAAAFVAHPYGRPILGWESDISRVTRPDAEDFFRRHYDVSRFVVAVVGGIKSSEVEAMARKYLEPIPSKGKYRYARIPVEPEQEGERRVQVEYDAEPSLVIGYHRPDMMSPDSAVFDVIAGVLNDGRTSRFNKVIVEKKKIAVSAWANSGAPGERDANIFVLGGSPRAPHTTSELEAALLEELENLKRSGALAQEIEKVKTNLEASLIRQLRESDDMADQLAYYECLTGDWKYFLTQVEKIRSVTAADIKRVSTQYFTRSNRTVAVLVRKAVIPAWSPRRPGTGIQFR